MLSWFWDRLTADVPWWVWLIVGVVAVLVAYRLLGKTGSLAAAGAAIAAILYTKGKQEGAEMRREQEKRDADKAIEAGRRARADAARRNADGGLHDSDGWKRERPVPDGPADHVVGGGLGRNNRPGEGA